VDRAQHGKTHRAARRQLVTGYPDGTFQPEGELSRAEAVTIINRLLFRGIEAEDIPAWAPSFTDLAPDHWAYANIIEAATDHACDRKETGYELWTGPLN
jgi:hypothetical protein